MLFVEGALQDRLEEQCLFPTSAVNVCFAPLDAFHLCGKNADGSGVGAMRT